MTYETTNDIESNTDTSHGVDNTLTHNNTIPTSRDLPAIPSPRIQQLMGAVIDARLAHEKAVWDSASKYSAMCSRLAMGVAKEYGIDHETTQLGYAWGRTGNALIVYRKTSSDAWEPLAAVSLSSVLPACREGADDPRVLGQLEEAYLDGEFEQEAA